MKPYPQKWRPALWMIVMLMVGIVLCLPLTSLLIFRFYDSQLVRETENELIVQSAIIREMFVQQMSDKDVNPDEFVTDFPKQSEDNDFYKLQLPQLDLTTATILKPRPDIVSTSIAVSPVMKTIGEQVAAVLLNAQKTTLSGYRLLDANGIVIGGRGELGGSLASVQEVKEALSGRYASVIRQRISDSPVPPIYSISRGTSIRVFVAMPIEYNGKVAGVVYMSRTPSHFLRELYQQRWKVMTAIGFILIVTFFLAYVFLRAIKNPIDNLNTRTERIRRGDKSALEPLKRHGTREIANLSEGLLNMSRQLQDRAEYLQTFATHVSHELKSPLTSIHGAAELLRDSSNEIDEAQQNRFLDNILHDTGRLTILVNRLRDLAQAENVDIGEWSYLPDTLNQLKARYDIPIKLSGNFEFQVGISEENLEIILANLIDNSLAHGATEIDLTQEISNTHIGICIADNGSGISATNAKKIFDVFFTTRRETGGTGMGLGIAKALLNAHDGKLELIPSKNGACFRVTVPKE